MVAGSATTTGAPIKVDAANDVAVAIDSAATRNFDRSIASSFQFQ
jgi:hypothetical protein